MRWIVFRLILSLTVLVLPPVAGELCWIQDGSKPNGTDLTYTSNCHAIKAAETFDGASQITMHVASKPGTTPFGDTFLKECIQQLIMNLDAAFPRLNGYRGMYFDDLQTPPGYNTLLAATLAVGTGSGRAGSCSFMFNVTGATSLNPGLLYLETCSRVRWRRRMAS